MSFQHTTRAQRHLAAHQSSSTWMCRTLTRSLREQLRPGRKCFSRSRTSLTGEFASWKTLLDIHGFSTHLSQRVDLELRTKTSFSCETSHFCDREGPRIPPRD